jgi:hypothetical protein
MVYLCTCCVRTQHMDLPLSHSFGTDLVDGMESDFHQKETILYLPKPNQKYKFSGSICWFLTLCKKVIMLWNVLKSCRVYTDNNIIPHCCTSLKFIILFCSERINTNMNYKYLSIIHLSSHLIPEGLHPWSTIYSNNRQTDVLQYQPSKGSCCILERREYTPVLLSVVLTKVWDKMIIYIVLFYFLIKFWLDNWSYNKDTVIQWNKYTATHFLERTVNWLSIPMMHF